MKNNSWYSLQELLDLGIKLDENPQNVCVSKDVRFHGIKNIQIGNNVRIDDFCVFTGNIKIGNFIHIGTSCVFIGAKSIELCDFCNISHKVSVFSVSDDFSGEWLIGSMIVDDFRNVIANEIIFKKHSVCGANSVVLPNSGGLEEGTALGAMSLLNKKTMPWTIYAGSPARKLKNRSKKVIELEKEFLNSLKR